MQKLLARKSAVIVVALATGIASIGNANAVTAAPQIETQQAQQVTVNETEIISNHTVASPSPRAANAENAEEEWAPLVLAAARGVIAAARAIPGAYRALSTAVKSGYNSFNTYCTTHAWCSAVLGGAAGVSLTELYQALRDLI